MKLVKTPVWIRLSYRTEAWTLKVSDERKIQPEEKWLWRRILRVS